MKLPPYPRYKPSGVEWLGDVPAHWDVKRIRHLALLKSGESITSSEIEPEGEYPVYGGNGLRGYTTAYSHDGHYVLIGRQGALCGNINYAKEKFWASEHAVVTQPLVSFEPIWMGELLRSMNLNQYSVSAAQPGLSVDTISALKIPVPPPPEQRAIAAFLDRETARLDTLIAKNRTLIERLKEKRTALISHAVTHGLNPAAKLKPSGIEWLGDVPAHWEVKRLDFLATVKARLGWKGLTASEYVPEGYIFLATPNIKGEGDIDFTNVNYITAERYFESPEIMVQVGDVLMAKDGSTLGTTNEVRHLPAPTTVNSSIAVLRPKPTLDSSYFFRWLTSSYLQSVIQSMKDGQGVPHLFQADIKQFTVLLPPLPEQRAIADFLDRETAKIDRLSAKIEDAIARLQEYRTALITAAVTGKIDVRGTMARVQYPPAAADYALAAESRGDYAATSTHKRAAAQGFQ